MSFPFVQRLRTETIDLHSSSQLKGHHAAPRVNLIGYTQWIKAQKDVHIRLQKFPLQPKIDYVEALDTELFYLDMELYHQDITLDIDAMPLSEYAMYLECIQDQQHILGCHWYNVVFAHLVGGNTYVAKSAAHVLPPNWIETSDFFQPVEHDSVAALRQGLEDLAMTSWTEEQRQQCVTETFMAFRLGTQMHHLLDSGDSSDTLPEM